MPNKADSSYLAVKPQVDDSTPIKPTNFIPLVSENIKTVMGFAPDRRLMGRTFKSDDFLRGIRKHEGDIVVLLDADTAGHILNMFFAKGSTTGNGTDGYTHPFTVGTAKHYTIEIQKGNYAQRYFGVLGDTLKLGVLDGQHMATATIKAKGQFSVATLQGTLAGAVTSLNLDTKYDETPNAGLTVGDVIVVGGTELTITSINANGYGVGFASTSVAATAGDPVRLKAQTPSYSGLQKPLHLGTTLVGLGLTSSAATTAAAAKSTATPLYSMAMTFKNNLFDAPASGSRDPQKLLAQVNEGQFDIDQIFESEVERERFLDATKEAATVIAAGTFIKTDLTTKELLTVKFHKIKAMENEEPLEVGQYIFYKQKFEALYDDSDAAAIDISLVNRTAGTSY